MLTTDAGQMVVANYNVLLNHTEWDDNPICVSNHVIRTGALGELML